jgi:hypothetical protein
VAVWEKCKEWNRPVRFGVQKQQRLLWTRQEQYNKKPLGSNRNKYKVGVIKGEILIVTPTTRPVVQEGDSNKVMKYLVILLRGVDKLETLFTLICTLE